MRVLAIEGTHALKNPDEAVSRHIQRHMEWADEGIDPALNREIAKDLRGAGEVLRRRDPEFLKAAAATRRVSRSAEREAIRMGVLKPETAAGRRANIAGEYGRTGQVRVTREQTPRDIAPRLARLDKVYEQRLAQAAEVVNPYDPKTAKLVTRERNVRRGRLKGGVRHGRLPTVKEEVRGLAEDALAQFAEAHPNHPTARMIRERDELHRRLNEYTEAQFGGPEVEAAGMPSLGKVSGFEKYGAPTGSFYYPTGERFKYPVRQGTGAPVSRRPSPQGLGPVEPSRYLQGTMRRFTGAGLRRGAVEKPARAIASVALSRQRLASVNRLQKQLTDLSTKERVNEYQIPIREGRDVPEHIRRQMAVDIENGAGGDQSALARAMSDIMESLAPAEGDKVRYLDARYIPQFVGGTPSAVAKVASEVNLPFRFTGVYARPAYLATNRPQNIIMRHMAQGRTRNKIRGSVRATRAELGPELSEKIIAAAGEARTESYLPQAGKLARKFEKATIERIQRLTDEDERFLSILGRAHERGYRDPKAIRSACSPRTRRRTSQKIGSRSRAGHARDLVDFSSLTPLEREVANIIYFYPWLSRGSAWAGRFVVQHPVKTAALAQLAKQGKEQQLGALGPVPDWMKGYIASRFGVSNPAPLNTFATPAQIADFVMNANATQARSIGEEFGTPAFTLAQTPLKDWPKEALRSTAPGQFARRLGVESERFLGKPTKTYPETGLKEALGPYVFGGPFPRHQAAEERTKQTIKEQPPLERVKARHAEFGRKLEQGIRETKLGDGLTPQLEKALKIRSARYENRARVGADKPGTTREKFAADADFLLRQKQITAAQAKRAKAWAKAEKRDYLVERELRSLSDKYFDDLYGDALSDAREKLRDKGYDLPKLR